MHMSRAFGGAQPVMIDTAIFQAEGYLGSHSLKMNVGETQSLVF